MSRDLDSTAAVTEPVSSQKSPRALLTTASIAVALAAADTYVVVLALTDMMAGVGLGIDALQRATPIISGFLLGYIAVLPLIGRLCDLTSRQKVLIGCLVIFVFGSALTALAHDLPTLVAGRVIQGVGGGGLVPATLAIVGQLWDADRRGVPLGIVGAVQELGSVVGPVLGALVLAVGDWRDIFWLNAILGVILAAMIWVVGKPVGAVETDPADADPADADPADATPTDATPTDATPVAATPATPATRSARLIRVVLGLLWTLGSAITALALVAPESLTTSVAYGAPFVPFGEATERLLTPIGVTGLTLLALALAVTIVRALPLLRQADVLGAFLLGGSLGCIIITFAAAEPEKEVVGPLGVTLLPVAVVLLAAYAWHQRVAKNPVVPRGTLTGRSIRALIVSFVVGVALVAVVVDIPVLARLTYTDSQVTAAIVLVRFLVAVPIGAFLGGVLLRRIGDGITTAIGLALAAAGLAVMATWGDGSLATVMSYVVLVAVGLGVGLALAPVNNVVLAETSQAQHGTASSLVVVARMIGMVVGLALLTGIGLHAYYLEVETLPDKTDADALIGAGLVQVHAVFWGAAAAAAIGALIALTLHRARASTTGPRLSTAVDSEK